MVTPSVVLHHQNTFAYLSTTLFVTPEEPKQPLKITEPDVQVAYTEEIGDAKKQHVFRMPSNPCTGTY